MIKLSDVVNNLHFLCELDDKTVFNDVSKGEKSIADHIDYVTGKYKRVKELRIGKAGERLLMIKFKKEKRGMYWHIYHI